MQQLDKFGWQKLFFSAKTIFVRTVFRVKKTFFINRQKLANPEYDVAILNHSIDIEGSQNLHIFRIMFIAHARYQVMCK